MNHPADFYKLQIEIHTEVLQKVRRKLVVSSSIRLVVFLIALFWSLFFLRKHKSCYCHNRSGHCRVCLFSFKTQRSAITSVI